MKIKIFFPFKFTISLNSICLQTPVDLNANSGDILKVDFIELDKFLVSKNEEKDGIKLNSPVSDPSHHPRISSFQGGAEGKQSKIFTKRELLKEKNKEK